MKKLKIIKKQKRKQNIWALKFIIECSFFVDGRLNGAPIRILILNLEKVKAGFEDLKGIGIHFFSKPIGDRPIGNAQKWRQNDSGWNQKNIFF